MDITPTTAPIIRQPKGISPELSPKAVKTANSFESFFMFRMLEQMNEGIMKDQSSAQQTFHTMMNEQLANAVAKGGKTGISQTLQRHMLHYQEVAATQPHQEPEEVKP